MEKSDRGAIARLERQMEEAWATGKFLCPKTAADRAGAGRLIRRGCYVRPFRGLYCEKKRFEALAPDEVHRRIVKSLAAAHPSWTFCSVSAAVILRLPVSYHLLEKVHVVTNTCTPIRDSQRIRRHPIESSQLTSRLVEGVQVTPHLQTAAECALTLPFGDSLAIADAALRSLQLSRDDLLTVVTSWGRRRAGYQDALKVARFADRRAESGGESIARAAMIDLGVIPSDVQATFVDPTQRNRRMRVDFLFRRLDGINVVVELDGAAKYEDQKMLAGSSTIGTLRAERHRESRLTLLGMPVLRITPGDVQSPYRLKRLLSAAGITSSSLAPETYLDTAS